MELASKFPEWAPADLALQCVNSQHPILTRLLTDPRMEKIWLAIRTRTDNPDYPMILWLYIHLLISSAGPNKSREAAEKQNSELAHHLQKAIALFDDSCLDTGNSENKANLIAMEQRASEIADDLKNDRIIGMNLIDRPVDYPDRTRLARSLTARFKHDFNQPLWTTTALLIEVVLNLAPNSVTEKWVQNTCDAKKLVKPLFTNLTGPG